MNRAPHVCLLLNNPFLTDSRSWKIASSLAGLGYRVTVVGREAVGAPAREERDGFRVIRLRRPRPLAWLPSPGLPGAAALGGEGRVAETLGRAGQALRYLLLTRAWARTIEREVADADIWQSEALVPLPVALRLARRHGGRVVYDSRDIHVESGRFARLPTLWKRLLARRERRWARHADAVITVSEPYRAVLERTLGRSVSIVMNCPLRWDPPEHSDRRFHRALGLSPDTRVVLYLGQVVAHRGIEQLMTAIGSVPNAVLAVCGFGAAYDEYRASAARQPHAERIHFLPGIAPDELLAWTAAADVSAIPLEPSTLNHRLNTPTKLFDAMGAGVPVVASDLPGMAPIVRETGCGVLCDPTDPADIARAIRDVLDAPAEVREAYRASARRAARERYSWERQLPGLVEVYRRLGAPPPVKP